jgi:hypothetical protein
MVRKFWRDEVLSLKKKHWYSSTKQHGVTFQKSVTSTITAARTISLVQTGNSFVLSLCYCSNQTVTHVSSATNCVAQSFLTNQQLLSQPRNHPNLYSAKFHGRFHKNTPPVPILSQISPIHVIPCRLRSIFVVSSPTTSGSSKWLLSYMFPRQNPTCTSPQQGSPALDLIARMSGDKSTQEAPQCANRFLVSSSHLGPNYLPQLPIFKHPQPTSFS